jgi:copper chaperone CopZ
LVKIEGVKKAETDGTTLEAKVVYDPKVTSAEKIAQKLGEENDRYKATVKSDA